MTSSENLISIMERGLLSHNEAYRLRQVTDISDPTVQELRSRKLIDDKPLHDYVCLYFSPRNPMLYVRKEMQDDIIILGIDPCLLLNPNTIFSDGNASAQDTIFYRGIAGLDRLPWNIINAPYWNHFEDGKRIKCAEVLVYPRVAVQSILKIFCYSNDKIPIIVEAMSGESIPVEENRQLYF